MPLPPDEREVLLTGRVSSERRGTRKLRAGPLRLELDGIDLRYITYQDVEVSEHVYVAVRDAEASNVPGLARSVKVVVGPGDQFEISFTCRHEAGGAAFEWDGTIVGTQEGRVNYRMDGVALTPFEYPRLGICVLHGARTFSGCGYRTLLRSSATTGVLPVEVGPQLYERGRLHGLTLPYERLELDPVKDLTMVFEFDGDQFQMEDQRNFGDSTFKTYSTPIEWQGPYHLDAGQRLSQRVTISVRDTRRLRAAMRSSDSTTIRLGAATDARMPSIGLGATSDGMAGSEAELARVAHLRPAHVRAEVMATGGPAAARRTVDLASAEARAVGSELWVDLFVSSEQKATLAELVAIIGTSRPIPEYVFVSTPGLEPPDAGMSRELLLETRASIGSLPGATFVGVGAQRRLAELNRWSFDPDVAAALSFPLSPTVHLADDATLISNLSNVGDLAGAARQWMQSHPVIVGPITLATRHGPYPAGSPSPSGLPVRVDARQVSLLAAAWTVGCISGLASAGVDGLTFFETVGWLGVTERDEGNAMPTEFRSTAGSVFPVWHVLGDAIGLQGGRILASEISGGPGPRTNVACLGVSDATGTHLLVSSLRDRRQEVKVEGIPGDAVTVRVLDEFSAPRAMSEPLAFRGDGDVHRVRDGSLPLRLDAYATVRLDVT